MISSRRRAAYSKRRSADASRISQDVDVNRLISATTAAVVGLSLNQAAYQAEIVRGGFAAVDKGQIEAADSLGMSRTTKLRRVIIPQAMPTIVPATGNQFIGMFKETSLVSVLGVAELLLVSKQIIARNFMSLEFYTLAGLIYFLIDYAIERAGKFVERRVALPS